MSLKKIRVIYFVLTSAFIVGSYFFILDIPIADGVVSNYSVLETAHFYQNPKISLSDIALKVFYVVPTNQKNSVVKDWRAMLKPVLDDAVRFHRVQFRGRSRLTYTVYPEVVYLNEDTNFYDGLSTNRGNPEGLKKIFEEIEHRVFKNNGDLFRAGFSEVSPGAFRALAFVYEGVGASGTDGALIVSRAFLSRAEYALIRSSLFYHEFGHVLGFPDRYDLDTNQPFSEDIMGSGRRQSIEITYIDRDLLKGVGVIR
ncbi:hypothetical protein HY967_02385 [Candidatus Jorgensenbacteria bacterium]|nr:hypothetical protein [Candidatus Jorgensenbacteria bacterium]